MPDRTLSERLAEHGLELREHGLELRELYGPDYHAIHDGDTRIAEGTDAGVRLYLAGLARGRKLEREACMRVATDHWEQEREGAIWATCALSIAAAIRQRGGK